LDKQSISFFKDSFSIIREASQEKPSLIQDESFELQDGLDELGAQDSSFKISQPTPMLT
jgi:hypothetical protein